MAGYECVFVEEPPKALQSKCPVCLLVLREPYQATCCGKSFCKECIEEVNVRSGKCPTCKTENFFSYPNKGLQQSLYDFEVCCSHKSKGCEWRGELRELEKHLNSEPPTDKSLEGCPFTIIKCPLNHTGCEVKLPRKDIKVHLNDNLLDHLLEQAMLVQTLLKDNKSLKREKDNLNQRVSELERKVNGTQSVPSHLGQPVIPVQFTMANFERHRREDEDWYSPPFYTHPRGYKMCVSVNPNGSSRCKGTHLSVSVHLMRGEFDDALRWPFRGKVAILLLDQEEYRDHNSSVLIFDDETPDQFADRVTVGERSRDDWGWGISDVCSLADLAPKYLKEDCIKLHIIK